MSAARTSRSLVRLSRIVHRRHTRRESDFPAVATGDHSPWPRETGIYRRGDSRYWWIAATLANGRRVRQSARTEDRSEAEALLAKLKFEAFREANWGIKPRRSWHEAAVRYLTGKQHLRSFADVRRICRRLDPYLGELQLREITGDVIWRITQDELKRGNQPATVNRYLAILRNLLRIARDEWQWIEVSPKIRLLSGENERDRWLTREEADRLIAAAASHLKALIRFALATGCRAREITGLEWNRVDLKRGTAWLDQTKNGAPRGFPLNRDAVAVLEAERDKHPVFCFTFRGEPIAWELTNSAWRTACKGAGISDFRFHDLRHYAERRIMPSGRCVSAQARRIACIWAELIRHNHRLIKKAIRRSSGRYRLRCVGSGAVLARAFSFRARSAARYICVVSTDSCPSQSAITERSMPR
jgi:integrase